MEVDAGNLEAAATLGDMIEVNVREEREAIVEYSDILKNVPRLNVLLYRALEDILKDEQEHLEELLALSPTSRDQELRKQSRFPLDVRTGVTTEQPGTMSSLDSRD